MQKAKAATVLESRIMAMEISDFFCSQHTELPNREKP
uniref:Uncharacterized protein n=1 Tax=Rhizophora mucronata TaxID=61149 RepID=A0A2P2N7H2_RHIMU